MAEKLMFSSLAGSESDMKKKILISLAVGFFAALWTIFLPVSTIYEGARLGDLCTPLFGLRNFMSGHFPFGGQYFNNCPIPYYPFTTMLAFYPFLFAPLFLIGPLFCLITSTVFSYALLNEGKLWKLFILLSPQYIFSLYSVQFAPLFAAALLLPCLLPVAVLKPQLGTVLLISGKWSSKSFLAMLLFIAFSLFVYPNWPADWLKQGNLSLYAGKIPVLQGLGCILLLSCLKWRDRRARLLSAMSLIPQRLWYDQLMLFLIPETRLQLYLVLIGSWLSVILSMKYVGSDMQHPTSWMITIYFLYLPMFIIVFNKEIIRLIVWFKNFIIVKKQDKTIDR
jgi:hypothetical protein